MRLLLIIVLLIYLNPKTYAANYFDFSADKYLINFDGEVNIDFYYNLLDYERTDFRIKPRSSQGDTYIYNLEHKDWVQGTDIWLNMPKVQKNLLLKISSIKVTELWFEIQNISNGEIYVTSTKKFYPYHNLSNSMRVINLKLAIGEVLEESWLDMMLKYVNEVTQGFR